MLEFCVTTRVLTEDDKLLKPRYQPGNPLHKDPEIAKRDAAILGRPAEMLMNRGARMPASGGAKQKPEKVPS